MAKYKNVFKSENAFPEVFLLTAGWLLVILLQIPK